MDCENCRHLTVVGLHDTGPRSLSPLTGGDVERKYDRPLRGYLSLFLPSTLHVFSSVFPSVSKCQEFHQFSFATPRCRYQREDKKNPREPLFLFVCFVLFCLVFLRPSRYSFFLSFFLRSSRQSSLLFPFTQVQMLERTYVANHESLSVFVSSFLPSRLSFLPPVSNSKTVTCFSPDRLTASLA